MKLGDTHAIRHDRDTALSSIYRKIAWKLIPFALLYYAQDLGSPEERQFQFSSLKWTQTGSKHRGRSGETMRCRGSLRDGRSSQLPWHRGSTDPVDMGLLGRVPERETQIFGRRSLQGVEVSKAAAT